MKSLAAILVLLAVAGCDTNSRTSEFKPGGATVRAWSGEVQYGNDQFWSRARVNTDLANGTQIRTRHDAEAILSLPRNGHAATIKLTADSELNLETIMVRRHISPEDTEATRAVLDLRKGIILGSVTQRSPDSSFQVHGSGVTLEVHGGDFHMSADGRVEAISSKNGSISVQAGGKTYFLHTGQSFDPKKNEVGTVPIIFDPPVTNSLHGPLFFLPGSWSPSLSPFDQGMENARHGGAPLIQQPPIHVD